MLRVKGKGDLIPYFDCYGWLDSGNQQSVCDEDLTLVGISDEEQGFNPSPEDVAAFSGVSLHHLDELGADAKSHPTSDRCVGAFLAGYSADGGIYNGMRTLKVLNLSVDQIRTADEIGHKSIIRVEIDLFGCA